ncbi:hypothetical protein E7Z59_06635 [Robertkochia marina]|uniref:Uncharacterized protein n=1 Tax=Robertkochia marina TaxID=1227945 RepID=A0A4S3M063_9FLAO|nr:hypothetical protein [Robertkochia marina]THD67333.1 hypothetical protein E7Z59_06635 [Robertkochia marina]TRZ42990.1 hypothetical protein D3A96_10940 [Robertkochia marina]
MNKDQNFCILNVKYEITEPGKDAGGTAKKTEIEHFFVAKKKDVLLEKIKTFENRLRNKKDKASSSLFDRIKKWFNAFLFKYKHSYNTLLRL